MECEVCGSESKKLVEISLEGARVFACPGCASLGTEVKHSALRSERKSTFFYKPKAELDTGPEVVEDFGARVRKAREKAGLKREELAKKIFEKASVIHRVEAGKYVPDDKTVKKLEEMLGLKLTE